MKYIWCQGNQSEPKKSFLLLSQCARSKRNVKSQNGSSCTTVRLHFGLRIGKKVKKFKPFGQTPPPLPRVTEQHSGYPLGKPMSGFLETTGKNILWKSWKLTETYGNHGSVDSDDTTILKGYPECCSVTRGRGGGLPEGLKFFYFFHYF